MNASSRLFTALLAAASAALAQFVDFRTEKSPEGWEFGDAKWNKDRGRHLADGQAITNVSGSVATQATVVVSFTQSNNPAPRLRVFAGPDAENFREVGSIVCGALTVFTTNVFEFAAEEGVRALKILADCNGNAKTYPYVVGAGFGAVPAAEVPDEPEPAPDAAVGALRFSALPPGVWREGFDACRELFPDDKNVCAWTNGASIAGWQAWQDGVAPEKLTRNQGKVSSVGLYAYWTADESAASYSLGMNVGSTAKEALWGVAFTNDTVHLLRDFVLAYTGRQFGFKNPAAQTVAVEWLVTNRLAAIDAEGDWRTSPGLVFTTPATAADGLASGEATAESRPSGGLDGAALAPGKVLLLRWRRLKVTNSAALGVDDVELRWTSVRERTQIVIR